VLLDTEGDDLQVNSFGSVGFSGFLTVVSRVRSWLQSAMKEELRPLFERCLRRRGKVVGQDNTFVGIREVCFTLETLDLAPHNFEEQGRLGKLLDDANEWGFEPMTMDFEAFVRFIRIVREWKASRKYTLDLAAAVKKFRFSEPEINEFRVAFDITDAKGNGEVDILGVRRIFKMLRWNISSDTLRAMFSKAKAEGGSTASFFEVLQILSAYATRRAVAEYENDYPYPKTRRGSRRMNSSPSLADDDDDDDSEGEEDTTTPAATAPAVAATAPATTAPAASTPASDGVVASAASTGPADAGAVVEASSATISEEHVAPEDQEGAGGSGATNDAEGTTKVAEGASTDAGGAAKDAEGDAEDRSLARKTSLRRSSRAVSLRFSEAPIVAFTSARSCSEGSDGAHNGLGAVASDFSTSQEAPKASQSKADDLDATCAAVADAIAEIEAEEAERGGGVGAGDGADGASGCDEA